MAQRVTGFVEKDGKLIPVKIRKGGFKTKTEALRAIPTLKPIERVPTLSYYYEAFENGKAENLSDSKKQQYRIAYDKLRPLWHKPIDQITVVELQALVSKACPTYYPARDMRVLLNHLYRLAGVDGKANPALPGLIELPKNNEKSREPFTQEEQSLLWKAYESGNKKAAIPLIMIYTGMMTGEIRSLTTEMIHWDTKEIIGVGLKTKERKSKSVLLPDTIIPVLEDVAPDVGKLYPMSEDNFYEAYYSALEEAGITRHLSPYSCRHTTATAMAVSASVAPQVVRRIMRWSSTKMMDRYVHPDDSDARSAINRL